MVAAFGDVALPDPAAVITSDGERREPFRLAAAAEEKEEEEGEEEEEEEDVQEAEVGRQASDIPAGSFWLSS